MWPQRLLGGALEVEEEFSPEACAWPPAGMVERLGAQCVTFFVLCWKLWPKRCVNFSSLCWKRQLIEVAEFSAAIASVAPE